MRPHPSRSRDGSPVDISVEDATGMRGRRKLVDIAAPQVGAADNQTSTLQRLAMMFNRWQEDRSVLLANPCEPFDEPVSITLRTSG
jgi:hypothetical protein